MIHKPDFSLISNTDTINGVGGKFSGQRCFFYLEFIVHIVGLILISLLSADVNNPQGIT